MESSSRVHGPQTSLKKRVCLCFRIAGDTALSKNIHESVSAQIRKNFAKSRWRVSPGALGPASVTPAWSAPRSWSVSRASRLRSPEFDEKPQHHTQIILLIFTDSDAAFERVSRRERGDVCGVRAPCEGQNEP